MNLGPRPRRHAILVVAAWALGCSGPRVEPAGGSGAKGGGTGGPGAASPDGGPGFTFTVSDAAPRDGLPAPGFDPGDEKCLEESHVAQSVPVDLLLLVDSSGSMNDKTGLRSKWEMSRDALVAFLKDARSAGLGVGLQFFPLARETSCKSDMDCDRPPEPRPNFWCHLEAVCAGPNVNLATARSCDPGLPLCGQGIPCRPVGRCTLTGGGCLNLGQACAGGLAGDTCAAQPMRCPYDADRDPPTCLVADYEKLAVPIAPLPAAELRLTLTIGGKVPVGGTPLGPAAAAALKQLRAQLVARPDRRGVLVIVSDGLPSLCETAGNDIPTIAAGLAAARQQMPSITTYVIGVFTPEDLVKGAQQALDQLATAGGPRPPFVLTPTDDLTQRFTEALNEIRGTALACEFKISPPTNVPLDFSRVNVRVTTSGGVEELPYVASAGRCDPMLGGWYYDVDPATAAPSRVLLCEATCRRVKADAKAGIELRFGCRTRVIP